MLAVRMLAVRMLAVHMRAVRMARRADLGAQESEEFALDDEILGLFLVGQVLQDALNGILGRDSHALGEADELSRLGRGGRDHECRLQGPGCRTSNLLGSPGRVLGWEMGLASPERRAPQHAPHQQ
jgi:hypothetical protein